MAEEKRIRLTVDVTKREAEVIVRLQNNLDETTHAAAIRKGLRIADYVAIHVKAGKRLVLENEDGTERTPIVIAELL